MDNRATAFKKNQKNIIKKKLFDNFSEMISLLTHYQEVIKNEINKINQQFDTRVD